MIHENPDFNLTCPNKVCLLSGYLTMVCSRVSLTRWCARTQLSHRSSLQSLQREVTSWPSLQLAQTGPELFTTGLPGEGPQESETGFHVTPRSPSGLKFRGFFDHASWTALVLVLGLGQSGSNIGLGPGANKRGPRDADSWTRTSRSNSRSFHRQ